MYPFLQLKNKGELKTQVCSIGGAEESSNLNLEYYLSRLRRHGNLQAEEHKSILCAGAATTMAPFV